MHEIRVVSRIALHLVILDLIGHIRHLVQKHPVMRHDHDRFVVAFQIIFQPLDCRQIQMVRRLVEQHDIRARQKQLYKRHFRLLPSGKTADRTPQILQCKSKPLEHRLHIPAPGISPHRLHLLLQSVILAQERPIRRSLLCLCRRLHLLLQLFHALLTGKHRYKNFF